MVRSIWARSPAAKTSPMPKFVIHHLPRGDDIAKALSPLLICFSSKVRLSLMYTIKRPFHFVIIAQARRMVSEISGLDEITLDVPPSMENSIVAAVDYAFFLSREKKPDAAPNLAIVPVKRTVTKVKLTREQFGKSPLASTEPADLAAVWAKLNNSNKENK